MNQQTDTITCSRCGRKDGISATFACFNKHGQVWTVGPKADGISHTAECPGGCGMKDVPYIDYTCEHCVVSADQMIKDLVVKHNGELSRLREMNAQRQK